MANTFQSGFKTTLAKKLDPADTTATLAVVPTVTAGRMYLTNGQQEERISFTGVSGSTITGLTRGLSKTAVPATAGTGLTWIAGTTLKLVAMHDQLIDRLEAQSFLGSAYIYADTAARDADLGGDGVATLNYTNVKTTADGLFWRYNTTTNVWESEDTGTVTPNASTTVAGKAEQGTGAQATAGTATGETGAPLFLTPADIAKVIQSGSYINLASATDSGTDAYVTTATPTLTAYTTGQLFVVTFAETNTTTTPTLNIDGLGAVTITDKDSVALAIGDITTNKLILMKEGSAFKIMSELPATTTRKGIQEMATDAEANTGTDQTRYINSLQLKNWSGYTVLADSTPLLQSANTARLTVSATYVKLKEIVATVAGDYYVSFEMSENGTSGAAYAQVFKNGVAFGTEQNTNDTSRVVKNETLTFAAGDLIQLYAKHTNPATGTYVRNFRLYGVIKPVSLTLTVNTD